MADEEIGAQPSQPQMNVLTQYVRRCVFENSAAINGKQPGSQPTINVQVNIETNDLEQNRYAVALLLTIETMNGDDEVFAVELDYVGVFQLANVPENALNAVLSIECPRLMFPFARRIIAESTRDGGYPPLMLDPIDFAALYRQQRAREAGQAAEPAATAEA
ncbi:MAG: protein-export chaperone SecB [Pseudomonadota bacterium]